MPEPSPQRVLGQMMTGYWISQAIYVAAKLGVADVLANGPRTVADLAGETKVHERSLFRLLRALASVGIFAEQADGSFGLTPVAETLRSDVPGSQRALAIMMGEEHFQSWADLLGCIRTSQPAFDRIFGKPVFQFLGEHPDKAQIFDAAMTSVHGWESNAMVDAYDFQGIATLMDVGGGNGSTLAVVLKRYPALQGVVFDLPHVAQRAAEALAKDGLAERCRTIGGSFFEAVPPGADAYLLRHIIHDWTEEQSTTILKNVHAAMPAEGRLLVVEGVIPPGNGPSWSKLLDLNMMVIPGGAERTEVEYRALFQAAGFKLTRVVPTAADVSVIEGVKA